MTMPASGRPTVLRRATSLLLAALFVAFVAKQAPHLVHHFFEPDLVQDECPFASSGDRAGAVPVEPVAVVATPDVSTAALPAVLSAPPSVVPDVSLGRAPPPSLS